MALRTFDFISFTPTAVAAAANFTNGTFMALQGGSGTQRFRFEEIYMGGQAGASSVNTMVLARDTVVGATTGLVALSTDVILDGSAGALSTAVLAFTSATTLPQRHASHTLLSLSFNAFGGIVRWVTSPQAYGPTGLGNTQPLGEISLSASNATGTPGLQSAHILYEPF